MQNREQARDISIYQVGFGLGHFKWWKLGRKKNIIEKAWDITWVLMIPGHWAVR